jgi:hypothetical protein
MVKRVWIHQTTIFIVYKENNVYNILVFEAGG